MVDAVVLIDLLTDFITSGDHHTRADDERLANSYEEAPLTWGDLRQIRDLLIDAGRPKEPPAMEMPEDVRGGELRVTTQPVSEGITEVIVSQVYFVDSPRRFEATMRVLEVLSRAKA